MTKKEYYWCQNSKDADLSTIEQCSSKLSGFSIFILQQTQRWEGSWRNLPKNDKVGRWPHIAFQMKILILGARSNFHNCFQGIDGPMGESKRWLYIERSSHVFAGEFFQQGISLPPKVKQWFLKQYFHLKV